MRITIFVVVGLVALFLGFRVFQIASGGGAQRSSKPGYEAFMDANRSITAYHGQTAFGNTADACKLAAEFASTVKTITQTRFTGGKASALSTSKGEVLVHCELSEGGCALIAHIPELRQYRSDVRDALATYAWAAAQQLVRSRSSASEFRLAVGLRGAALYGPVLVGRPVGPPASSDSGTSELEKLYLFFVPAPRASSATRAVIPAPTTTSATAALVDSPADPPAP
ncbi:MAG: hypothetical protein H0V44_18985 [Planctomycetes bacterium]|nr:hypothetical protein [Planctomycetota bacterium]